MKTRAFKKALSVLCVLSMLLSVCVVSFAGTASAATATYTFNNSGKVYTRDLEAGAALTAPEAATDGVTFVGWYDKTFTTKYETAGSEKELYAKYDGVTYTFDDGKGYYDPNNAMDKHSGSGDWRIVDDPLNTYSGNKVLQSCNVDHGNGLNMGFARYNGLTDDGFKPEAGKSYIVTFKVYITGWDAANRIQPQFNLGLAKSAGLGVGGNKIYHGSTAVMDGNTSGWVNVTLFSNTISADDIATYPYLILIANGGCDHTSPVKNTVMYYDDFVISEVADKTITFVDRGVETVQTLKSGSALPSNASASFLGWYDVTRTIKYTTVPTKNTTLYAVYNGTFANFEKTGYYDPNNKIGSSQMTISVVNDPLGVKGKVAFFNMSGNKNMIHFAPSAAEGISKAGLKLTAGQYRMRYKYYVTDVNADGVLIEVRMAKKENIGLLDGKSGVLASTVITASTTGWVEADIIFTLGASDAASYDAFIVCAQDGKAHADASAPASVATAKLYIDEVDVKPYIDASAIANTEMKFENNFAWSVPAANNYTASTGNGYVTRGQIVADASANHYFQIKHFRNRNGYFWFTVNDGTTQFQLKDGALYTVEFDYYVVHSETPASIGILAVDPTKSNSITAMGEIASFEYRDDTDKRTPTWVHAKYTFAADTDNNRTSLGIYVKNTTNVPEEYATVINFDNVVVTTHSVSGEDGIIVFDGMGADFSVDPIVVESGYTTTLPTPAKYGYDFMGWKYKVETGKDSDNKPIYEVRDLTNNTVIFAGVLNAYAEWKVSDGVAILHFNSNVPEFDAAKHTAVARNGQAIVGMPANPSASGQKFLGWYLDTTFKTPLDASKAPNLTGDVNVYAKWDSAPVIIDYEEYDNKEHGAGRFSDRFNIISFQGSKVLCYDFANSKSTDPGGLARAQFYDGKNYIRAYDGLDYTISFKYYVVECPNVGDFAIFTHTDGHSWGRYTQQDGKVAYSPAIGRWTDVTISFTARRDSTTKVTDNYMSIAVSGDAIIYIDDVVISCKENTMNHYGTALLFATGGGNELPTISGQPGEAFTLPTPKRSGYIFTGWYKDAECTDRFTDTVYPEDSMQLFAGWRLGRLVESFEDISYTVKGLGYSGAYTFYTETAENYDPANIVTGKYSLFRDGSVTGDNKTFTLSKAKNIKLDVGSDYTVSMLVKPTSIIDTNSTISLVSLPKYLGITNGSSIGIIAYAGDLKEGEWQEISFHFTATSKYVGINTTAGCDMYIDDVSVTLDGYTGSATGDSSVNPILVLALTLVAAGALIVTGKKVFAK